MRNIPQLATPANVEITGTVVTFGMVDAAIEYWLGIRTKEGKAISMDKCLRHMDVVQNGGKWGRFNIADLPYVTQYRAYEGYILSLRAARNGPGPEDKSPVVEIPFILTEMETCIANGKILTNVIGEVIQDLNRQLRTLAEDPQTQKELIALLQGFEKELSERTQRLEKLETELGTMISHGTEMANKLSELPQKADKALKKHDEDIEAVMADMLKGNKVQIATVVAEVEREKSALERLRLELAKQVDVLTGQNVSYGDLLRKISQDQEALIAKTAERSTSLLEQIRSEGDEIVSEIELELQRLRGYESPPTPESLSPVIASLVNRAVEESTSSLHQRLADQDGRLNQKADITTVDADSRSLSDKFEELAKGLRDLESKLLQRLNEIGSNSTNAVNTANEAVRKMASLREDLDAFVREKKAGSWDTVGIERFESLEKINTELTERVREIESGLHGTLDAEGTTLLMSGLKEIKQKLEDLERQPVPREQAAPRETPTEKDRFKWRQLVPVVTGRLQVVITAMLVIGVISMMLYWKRGTPTPTQTPGRNQSVSSRVDTSPERAVLNWSSQTTRKIEYIKSH